MSHPLDLARGLKAYSAAQGQAAGLGPTAAATGGGSQFGSLLKSQLEDAGHKLQASESSSIAALGGKADLQQVVEAVTAAELGLQKVTAVRDRVISAYQDILRMPI